MPTYPLTDGSKVTDDLKAHASTNPDYDIFVVGPNTADNQGCKDIGTVFLGFDESNLVTYERPGQGEKKRKGIARIVELFFRHHPWNWKTCPQ